MRTSDGSSGFLPPQQQFGLSWLSADLSSIDQKKEINPSAFLSENAYIFKYGAKCSTRLGWLFDNVLLCEAVLLSTNECVRYRPGLMATARVQPAEARSIFTGKEAIAKPFAGSCSKLLIEPLKGHL